MHFYESYSIEDMVNFDLSNAHWLYRFLDSQKNTASNLAFQAFEGFIGT